MSGIEGSALISNYKAFGADPQGFDQIKPINVVIGRNNSGKSALLDLIEFLVEPRDLSAKGYSGESPLVRISVPATSTAIERVFQRNTSGGSIGGNHFDFGKKWIGSPITVAIAPDGTLSYISAEPDVPIEFRDGLVKGLRSPAQGRPFGRISAERDIRPDAAGDPGLAGDGTGATNLIEYVLNDSKADQHLVDRDMLNALNKVFEPDTKFTRIHSKRISGSDRWEIYLQEEAKGSIALSDSGSGLKTVILVLAFMLLLPRIKKYELSSYILVCEELENNLHPGLQRRLFTVLRDWAVDNGVTVFLSTHSSVVIDLFSGDSEAQIVHVVHDNTSAFVSSLGSDVDHGSLLDDLDVRASDLLQSNGVIWVEGPSDRVYVNGFLRLLHGERFREGAHYQCVFYGGRLLARLALDPDNSDAVNILAVNRHCYLVMDRDTQQINTTKRRMKDEVEAAGGGVWVTNRKEIECLIPVEALRAYYNDPSLPQVKGLMSFSDYLDSVKPKEGRRYSGNKVAFAEAVLPYVTKDMLESDSRLMGELKKLTAAIESWNRGI